MKLGCCISSADQLPVLAAAGADYCELPLARMVMGVAEPELEALRAALAETVPARACNVFLPPELRVVGPGVDARALEGYVTAALERAGRLGVAMLVFGSGRSRNVPEGFGRERAIEQLAAFLDATGARCERAGVALALEPLGAAESNLINSVGEGASFLARWRPRGTRLLADLYHMMEENEPLSAIDEYADLIVHTHVADSGRAAPGTGTYPIAEFFQKLRANNYQGKCSIECRWDDFTAQIGPAMAAVRDAARSAGW